MCHEPLLGPLVALHPEHHGRAVVGGLTATAYGPQSEIRIPRFLLPCDDFSN
jgi:hypothetical protein